MPTTYLLDFESRITSDRLSPAIRNLSVAKTLCDWKKKDIEKNRELLAELLRSPRYYCRKCARGAAISKVLCKPARLPKASTSSAMTEEK